MSCRRRRADRRTRAARALAPKLKLARCSTHAGLADRPARLPHQRQSRTMGVHRDDGATSSPAGKRGICVDARNAHHRRIALKAEGQRGGSFPRAENCRGPSATERHLGVNSGRHGKSRVGASSDPAIACSTRGNAADERRIATQRKEARNDAARGA
jgi:hypothetical protein